MLKPLMAAPNPSIPLRRAYGLAMTFLGFSQGNSDEEEAAVVTLEEARKAYRSIDNLKLNDLPVGGRVCGSIRLADGCAADIWVVWTGSEKSAPTP